VRFFAIIDTDQIQDTGIHKAPIFKRKENSFKDVSF
jgi:hypothetical protein